MRISPLFTILFFACLLSACGGGDGGSHRSATPPPVDPCADNACVTVHGKAMLGPVIGANVKIYDALQPGSNPLCEATTQDAESLQDAGSIEIPFPCLGSVDAFVVEVSGGQDVDAEDDGARDLFPTPVLGRFRAFLSRDAMLANAWKVSALTEVVYQSIDGIQRNTLDQSFFTQLDQMASALLSADVNADGEINYGDVIEWNPILDKECVRDIYRVQEQARTILENRNKFVAARNLQAPYLAQVNPGTGVRKIVASDTHVFVGGPASIKVVSANTRKVIASIPVGFFSDFALSGQTLWVAMGAPGVRAYDVSDPASPRLLAASSDQQVDRLATNDNVWAAWITDGRARIGRLLVEDAGIFIADQRDLGSADYLGVFKPIDDTHVALSALLMSLFAEELRVFSHGRDGYQTIYTTPSMNSVSDLSLKNQTLYLVETAPLSGEGVLRSFEVRSLDEPFLNPINVLSGRQVFSLAWAGDALMAVTSGPILSLNPYTFEALGEYETLAPTNMMVSVQDKHWIAFSQAGLVEAQFPTLLIAPNQEVGIDFGALHKFTYDVFVGESLCYSESGPVDEVFLPPECFDEQGYVTLQITGGELQDANYDGQIDAVVTPFKGVLSSIVSEYDLRIGAAHISLLSDAAFRVMGGKLLAGNINLDEYQRSLDILANVWLNADIDGSGVVNRMDLQAWTPAENIDRTVFDESQIAQYDSAVVNADNVDAALSALTGALRDVLPSDYRFRALGGNSQYLVGVVDHASASQLYLMDASNTSTRRITDTLAMQDYVFSLEFSGNYAYVSTNNGGALIEIVDGHLSLVRDLPGCEKAAWAGTDLICLDRNRVSRIDALTGNVRWTTSFSADYVNSVYLSSGIFVIDAGIEFFNAKLILINAANGSIRAETFSDISMSTMRPFGVADGAVYTYFRAMSGNERGRLERRSLDNAAVLASVDYEETIILNSLQVGNAFSLVTSGGLLTIGASNVQVQHRRMSGLSTLWGAVQVADNWVVLTEDGNMLVYSTVAN